MYNGHVTPGRLLYSTPPHPPDLNNFFHDKFCNIPLALGGGGGGDTEVPFRTERSTVTYSQRFDQLEVSGLLRTTVPWEVGTAS